MTTDPESATITGLERNRNVESRFGLLPNFFRLAPQTPEITDKMWGFAQAAYLDNPLPSLFKERLFVRLSRFCGVRYCIARHVGFLVGLGHPAGDSGAGALSITDVIKLLRRRLPRDRELHEQLATCASCPSPLPELPATDSQLEDAIFALAGHVFLQTTDSRLCLEALGRLLGEVRLQYLLLLLAFIRAAHYWTKVHPEIEFEDDIKKLLATHEALADCILNDPEASTDNVTQSLLDELPALRLRADTAIGLLAAIVDSSEDAIVSKTLEGIVTSWNAGAKRLFGYTPEEAIGQHITFIIPPELHSEETEIIGKIRRGERIEHFDTVRLRKDGTTVDISLTISPLRNASGTIIGASKIARDISERKRSERALRDSEERYRVLADALEMQVQFRTQELRRRNTEILEQSDRVRDLSARLLQLQDRERRHIARELHDSAGQTLAALSINLAIAGNNIKAHPEQAAADLQSAQELIQHLTQEIRTTSYLLHPPLLDESGLSSALSWYVQGLSDRSKLEIDLKISQDFGRLPPDLELVVFRLVQESLTNIHRHSGSKTATIRLERKPDHVRVEVEDAGKGMSPEKLSAVQTQRAGVGLGGMRERVHHFQGELTIESTSAGTKIKAILPLKNALATEESETKIRQVS